MVMLKSNAFETDVEITDGNQSKLKGRTRGFLSSKRRSNLSILICNFWGWLFPLCFVSMETLKKYNTVLMGGITTDKEAIFFLIEDIDPFCF